jgi:transposase-like protein
MNTKTCEDQISLMNEENLIYWAFEKELLHRSIICDGDCESVLSFGKASNYVDGYAWRCKNSSCINYRKRISVRKNSFFQDFTTSLKSILKLLLKWSTGQQRSTIVSCLDISAPTQIKKMNKLIERMKVENDVFRALGGPGLVVQIDETMLNYKCKSHRGRSLDNRTDALFIVEVGTKIQKIYAEIIPDKTIQTILPIIQRRVVPGLTIYTDEHRNYNCLQQSGFTHGTICHKFNFVNPSNQVHTQNVESLNNF